MVIVGISGYQCFLWLLWLCMVISGYMHGYQLLLVGMHGYMHGYQWLCMIISGYMHGYQWLSVVMHGNQWLRIVISGQCMISSF